MKSIEAKIAMVFDQYRVALNVGDEQGVSEGDLVRLYRTVNVVDPDTSEPLGAVRIDKVQLRVSDVQSRMSIAEVPLSRGTNWVNNTFANVLGDSPRRRVRLKEEGNYSSDESLVLIEIGEPVLVFISEKEEVSD